MDVPIETLKSLLQTAGQSVTKPRVTVFRALAGRGPMSMRQLIGQVTSIDRASVYRTIDLFERLGVVQRVNTGWKYKLELTDMFNEHHHHLTCTNCGSTTDMNEQELEQVIDRLATTYRFRPSSHQIEIQGLCMRCVQSLN